MRITFVGIAIAALLLLAPSAGAATVCFDWECDDMTGYCTFDASCSSASPYIWKYEFDWGDGTGTGLSGLPTHDHTYSTNVATVTLKIHVWAEPSLYTHSCEIVAFNIIGPGVPTYGRCTN